MGRQDGRLFVFVITLANTCVQDKNVFELLDRVGAPKEVDLTFYGYCCVTGTLLWAFPLQSQSKNISLLK